MREWLQTGLLGGQNIDSSETEQKDGRPDRKADGPDKKEDGTTRDKSILGDK